jgi:hypothetical protein
MSTAVSMRSYDIARTGVNIEEKVLTPQRVGSNLLRKLFSVVFDDDPRLEAQPLYVPGLAMSDGRQHDVLYVCTMANNVWAFDANDGNPIWPRPVNLGRPIKPGPDPHNPPPATEIDRWGINILWGILSTPVMDLETKTLYAVIWTSPDDSVNRAVYQLHAIDITNGRPRHDPLTIEATADGQAAPGAAPARFVPSRQKQRASLLLTKVQEQAGSPVRKTLFVGFGMTHEEHDPTHGWLIAYDVDEFRRTAAWCTTPHGTGCGIWQAGQGPAADEAGDIYVMTGNYGNENTAPAAGDLPESIIKLHYTPPADHTSQGKLEPVAWFTPFRDVDRADLSGQGQDNFKDYDLGSGGPVPIPGMNLVVGAGKDGVVYVLDKDTAKFGKGSDYAVLKQPPLFFTYFPGFRIDASQVRNLDRLYTGKTHHLHGTPAFWRSPTHGPMLFVWGENECLRAWTLSETGELKFLAKSAEVASAGMGGKGGMPGGFLAVTSDGVAPNTGIVWTLTPLSGDANMHVVRGILRAYDATNLDPMPNSDGTPRLKLLWHSDHIPNNDFNHSKFCPPVVADGKVFVPTYDGRVHVYGLHVTARGRPRPTNARRMPQ